MSLGCRVLFAKPAIQKCAIKRIEQAFLSPNGLINMNMLAASGKPIEYHGIGGGKSDKSKYFPRGDGGI